MRDNCTLSFYKVLYFLYSSGTRPSHSILNGFPDYPSIQLILNITYTVNLFLFKREKNRPS